MHFRSHVAALASVGFGLVVSPWQLFALNPQKTISQFTRTVWTQAQGLPQDTIRAITQTPDGYLWAGTNEGLARFDGYEFTSFTKDDGSLPSNSITALLGGQSGLWIGTLGGLAHYADGRFKIFTAKDGLQPRTVNALVEDQAGVIWVASGGLLSRYENQKFTTYPKEQLAPIQLIQVVYEDPDRQLWIGGVGGLVKRNGNGFATVLGPKELDGNIITGMVKDARGLWIAGTRGIILMRPDGVLKRFDTRDGLPDNLVRTICEDRAGNLWAGTNGGLSRLENGRFVSPPTNSKDDNDWVWSLFEDREGDLWVGMNGSLNRFRDDLFTIYGRTEGLPSDEPIVVHQDRRGEIWMGYHNSGLVAFNSGKFRVYTTRDGLPSNEIFSIRDGRDGDLLIGTRRGLSRMHAGRFSNYTVPDPLGRQNVYDAIEDSTGHLWTATSSGVYQSTGGSWRSVVHGDSGGRGYAIALTEGLDGSIWAGMLDSGVWRIAPGAGSERKARRFTKADGLPTDQIRSLYQDPDGTLWIGTLGGGLISLRDGVFHSYAARDGLLTDNISYVTDDGKGDLWLSTPRGISRISKQALKDFSANRIHILTPVNYGLEDGLRSAQCAPGFPTGGGAALTREGQLWFPTGRGLATIDPNRPAPVAPQAVTAPTTRLVGIEVDGRALDFAQASRLQPGNGRVQFRYAGIYLKAPERIRYFYKLIGLDKDWISAGNRRVINYNPLPHGRYRFAVRSMLVGGGTSENQFAFEVLPHYYETSWFLWLCLATFLGAVFGVYRLRLRQISSRFALVLEERARLAREIHDTLAQGFVGISSQLDALAIKLNGDMGVARQHLDLARKMARHSLTEARRSVMDLRTSELEGHNLSAALVASAYRWVAGSPVNVQVEVSSVKQKLPEDLEQNLLRIAQEAVANALKHARAAVISVTLQEEAGILLLRVEDDGQGFEPSSEFSLRGGHFGILGMRERAEKLGGQFNFTSHPGAGTQVEVKVPLASRNSAFN